MTDARMVAGGEAEARWRALVEQVPAVIYTAEFDADSTLLYVSPRIEELTGHPAASFLEDPELWYSLIHPDDLERVRREEARSFREEIPFDVEYRMVRRDGTVIHVWERDAVVRDEHRRPLLTQGVLVDVTHLRRVEEALRSERNRAQQYLDTAGTVVVALDLDGRVTMLNGVGHEILGYRDGELLGVDWFETCVPEELRESARERVLDSARSCPADEAPEVHHAESPVVGRDGTQRTMLWGWATLVEDGRVVGTIASGIDVTDRRRAEEQVAYLAYHDSLTGLPNRMLLQEHLELALARARRARTAVALLYVDLDDFKLVNDGLGHAAGDELLSQVGGRLARHIRDSDTLARQGGDEFLLLIPDIEEEGEARATAAAERILEAIREPFRIGGTEFEIGASVGIALFPDDAKDADTLLEHADAAMYEAKADHATRMRVYRPEPRSRRGVERLSFSRRLRQAIEGGELVLHWQPMFTVADGALLGFEALVRWEDPRHGLRSAGEFVPVAERSAGLLDLLDDWVIAALSEQRRAWRAAGYDPQVSFNLSPRQLRPDRLAAMLDGLRTGGPLDRVLIELIEGVAGHDDIGIRSVMAALGEAGVVLGLDDFGVAYSSLSRLTEMPVRVVKVDRSFLREVPGNDAAVALLGSILTLVEALGLDVIVEGVESEEQLVHLREIGVPNVQGYHLAPPAAAGELEALLLTSAVAKSA